MYGPCLGFDRQSVARASRSAPSDRPVLADVRARLEAEAARHVDLADAAVLHELDRLAHGRAAAVHRADLHDLAVGARRVDHLAPFPDGVRRRLLDVDVLAGLQRPDRGERVPVIRNRDDDGVDVLVVEDAPQVLHVARLERRDILQRRVVGARGEQVLVDVAERLDLDVLELGEALLQRVALSVDADAGGHDFVVGAEHAAPDEGAAPTRVPNSSAPTAAPATATPRRDVKSRRVMPLSSLGSLAKENLLCSFGAGTPEPAGS